MKTFIFILLLFFTQIVFSQETIEKEISTQVEKATVFFDGAQITRTKNIEIPEGVTLLKFTTLSPFIDAKSIQVKAKGNFTVLSVNHQLDFIDEPEKSQKVVGLEDELKKLEKEIEKENTQLYIINDQIEFLNLNREIGGNNQNLKVAELSSAEAYYSKKMTELRFEKVAQKGKIEKLEEKEKNIENQLKTASSVDEFPNGEIWVKIESTQPCNGNFELNYMVNNVGWFPSYDIKSDGLDQPLEIVYKANLRQDTKIEWKDVRLTFASIAPKNSGVAPELKTYFLDYYSKPPVYKSEINSVSGYITDQNNEPLIGAAVLIENTSIGAVADANGYYSITIPDPESKLVFSYIGYESQTRRIEGTVMNVKLKESNVSLDEVVTVRSMSTVSSALQGRVAGLSIEKKRFKSKDKPSIAIPFEQIENSTSLNFEIQKPYSVKSDNKSYSVEMTTYEIPVTFQYYSVPKITPEVFLKAYVTDWEAYNFLEGEANIYVDGTFIGKSLLDNRFSGDTLEVSLGVDKNISIQRKKIKDLANRQFIGTKKEEVIAWKTIVKNSKSQTIDMVVFDQVPVSKKEEIEVDIENKSNGHLEEETGEISWTFELKPGETKELTLKYEVKYPKSKRLTIE